MHVHAARALVPPPARQLLEDKSGLDQEVLELDRQAEQKKMVLAVVSDPSDLPTLARAGRSSRRACL